MSSESLPFVTGGGDMGARIRDFDWSATPLGPLAQWPQSLKIAVRIMLTSRQPIWIGWGADLYYLYNDAYKSIIGGKHPWALGRPTRDVWREIWEKISPLLAQAMGGDEGTYVESQLLIMERSGYPEETYYTYSYSPIPAEDGNTGGIICANTDDTQRVIGERQLSLLRELAAAGSEARTLREVYEASARALATNQRDLPFALIYFAEPGNDDLSLVSWSPIGQVHPSVPKHAAINETSLWSLAKVIRDQTVHVVDDLEACFGTAVFPPGSWDRRPKQAALIPIPSRGETGRPGVLVTGLNPFRQFDETYHSFLMLAAGEIAAALANAQAYEEGRRRAEALTEIDRAKTLFFSNVSHEFRTPLTLMLAPLEEVLAKPEGEISPDNRALVELAHRNGVRLLKLVNSLLDFSRIEAGRARAIYEPVDLAHQTIDLASNFRSACERAGLRLVINCPPLTEATFVDRDMWEKIVLNLLSNAFKFTFVGEIEVLLRQGDGYAELLVRDTGIGIAEAEVPKLFERFHRIEGQKSRTHEGTGIGLALVLELVKLHGGTIQVESALNRGTTFTVRLPLGSAHLPVDQTLVRPSVLSTSIRADAFVQEALRWLPDVSEIDSLEVQDIDQPREILDLRAGSRILLADDNADMREYIRRLLSAHCEVHAVSDGLAALKEIREHRPNLILADVMMPGLDGFELLHEIRADASMRDIPVILLSARADEQSRVEGLEVGADDYLIKPFSARELLARVKANLRLADVRSKALAAIRESEQQLRWLGSIVESNDDAIVSKDLNGIITSWNAGAERVFGYTAEEAIGQPITIVIPEDRQREEREILTRIRRGEHVEHFETVRRHKHGNLIAVSLAISPVKDSEGKVVGASKIARDITEQKRNQELITTLAREAEHRSKNVLANVQAMVSLSQSDTPEGLKKTIEGRIHALAKVHSLFVESRWIGADLSAIATQELAPYGETRVRIDGVPILLEPGAAQAIAMTLHELATNASKYGALSVSSGQIDLRWSQDSDGCLRLCWSEVGGPAVEAPTHKGFGGRIIEAVIAQQRGKTCLKWRKEGLVCEISLQV
jgi:PAS domain S-box-containing protein